MQITTIPLKRYRPHPRSMALTLLTWGMALTPPLCAQAALHLGLSSGLGTVMPSADAASRSLPPGPRLQPANGLMQSREFALPATVTRAVAYAYAASHTGPATTSGALAARLNYGQRLSHGVRQLLRLMHTRTAMRSGPPA